MSFIVYPINQVVVNDENNHCQLNCEEEQRLEQNLSISHPAEVCLVQVRQLQLLEVVERLDNLKVFTLIFKDEESKQSIREIISPQDQEFFLILSSAQHAELIEHYSPVVLFLRKHCF